MKRLKPPTERQNEFLCFIKQYTKRNGFPPTLREIGAELGVKSTNGVRSAVNPLIRKGYLRYTPFISRSLVVTKKRLGAH